MTESGNGIWRKNALDWSNPRRCFWALVVRGCFWLSVRVEVVYSGIDGVDFSFQSSYSGE